MASAENPGVGGGEETRHLGDSPDPTCAHCLHVAAEADKKIPRFTQGNIIWPVVALILGMAGAFVIAALVENDADRLGALTLAGVTVAAVAAMLRATAHQRKDPSDVRTDHLGKLLGVSAFGFTFIVATTQLGDYFTYNVQPRLLFAAIGLLVLAGAWGLVRTVIGWRKKRKGATSSGTEKNGTPPPSPRGHGAGAASAPGGDHL